MLLGYCQQYWQIFLLQHPMLFNGISAYCLMLSTIVLYSICLTKGHCYWEDNESCGSSLTFHCYSSTTAALACCDQQCCPAGEWDWLYQAAWYFPYLLRCWIAFIFYNQRITGWHWFWMTLYWMKQNIFSITQCSSWCSNNQWIIWLFFVDTFRRVYSTQFSGCCGQRLCL